jgi:hypothetical protein
MDPEQYLIADEDCIVDVSKAERELGWRPRFGDDDMLLAAYAEHRKSRSAEPIARGRAGPNLLALLRVSKYAHHLSLNRQSMIYGREGVEIDVSTLADCVGAVAATADRDREAQRLVV